ncbi:MAG: TolC family protein [Acidobacteriaceae bacterium]|nr:TolC family protein [Acidobacteriaceae bacterium]
MKVVLTLRFILIVAITAVTATAEVHSLTLQQALEVAARQNPDVTLARLDQQRAEEGVYVALDPFRPKVYAGSGLAYTSGYPSSIEGNAPSIIQARTDMSIYNRAQTYTLRSARETARGSQWGVQDKAEQVAYEAADLFLTASDLEHDDAQLTAQIPSLQKVVDVMSGSVREGSELPVELTRARVNLQSAQVRLDSGQLDADYYEMMLAVALGYSANDRVKPVDSETVALIVPPSESAAADSALSNNRELREMQSNVLAKQLDLNSYRAARLPKVDLVAQYALFAKYNYQQYFQKFQRNNFEIGASVTIPILIGTAVKGYMAQALTDMQKIRVQMDQVRNRVLSDTRRSYEQWQKAEKLRDLARLQLDLARQDLTVLLAQNQEGRMPLSRVEQARLEESNRWISMYDAETQVTRAKLAILRQTGNLLATLRNVPSAPSN